MQFHSSFHEEFFHFSLVYHCKDEIKFSLHSHIRMLSMEKIRSFLYDFDCEIRDYLL